MLRSNILVVDDDVELGSMLLERFAIEGFSSQHATSGAEALDLLEEKSFDLLVVDVMMPGIDGFELLRRIRLVYRVPVVMLTARGDDADKIAGFEIGADDYLPKPFNPNELVARVRAILRRCPLNEISGPVPLSVGPLQIDARSMIATFNGQAVRLTTAEFLVLEALARSVGQPQTRRSLCYQALGRPLEAFDRSIDTHVSNIRRKLSLNSGGGMDIRSSRGHGYVLTVAKK